MPIKENCPDTRALSRPFHAQKSLSRHFVPASVSTLCPTKCRHFVGFAQNVEKSFLKDRAHPLDTKNTASRENADFAFCTSQATCAVRPFRLVESGRTFFKNTPHGMTHISPSNGKTAVLYR
jgi:hypothetical protein